MKEWKIVKNYACWVGYCGEKQGRHFISHVCRTTMDVLSIFFPKLALYLRNLMDFFNMHIIYEKKNSMAMPLVEEQKGSTSLHTLSIRWLICWQNEKNPSYCSYVNLNFEHFDLTFSSTFFSISILTDCNSTNLNNFLWNHFKQSINFLIKTTWKLDQYLNFKLILVFFPSLTQWQLEFEMIITVD